MVRRMPYLRGFKNKWRIEYQVLNLADLSDLPDGHAVALEDLIVSGAINKNRPLKILGDGELTVKLTVEAHNLVVARAQRSRQLAEALSRFRGRWSAAAAALARTPQCAIARRRTSRLSDG